MVTLWLTLLSLLLLAAAGIAFAAKRRRLPLVISRDSINKSIYRHRLEELDEEVQQGRIARHDEMVEELQQTLLVDIPTESSGKASATGRMILWPGILLLVVVTLVLYSLTGGYRQLQVWNDINQQYPQLRAQVMDPQATPLTMEQMARFAVGLRSQLLQHPHNSDDWLMLGRVAMVLNDGQRAKQAFQRALQLVPSSTEAKLSYAEVLVRLQHREDAQQASEILNALYANNKQDLRIINLLAWNAYQQADYPSALTWWQQLLTLLPAEDPRRTGVQEHIVQTQAKMSSPAESDSGKTLPGQ